MNMMTTRRSAVAAIALAALVPTAATALSQGDRNGWTLALSRYRSATDDLTCANKAHSDAEELYFQRRPDRPTLVMDMEGDCGRFGKHVLPITIHHDELDDHDQVWADPERIGQFRRELASYRATDAALRRELDLDRLEDASLAAMQGQSDALQHLVGLRAPDLTALAEKIAIIMAEYGETDGTTSAVLADVRRFAGEA